MGHEGGDVRVVQQRLAISQQRPPAARLDVKVADRLVVEVDQALHDLDQDGTPPAKKAQM